MFARSPSINDMLVCGVYSFCYRISNVDPPLSEGLMFIVWCTVAAAHVWNGLYILQYIFRVNTVLTNELSSCVEKLGDTVAIICLCGASYLYRNQFKKLTLFCGILRHIWFEFSVVNFCLFHVLFGSRVYIYFMWGTAWIWLCGIYFHLKWPVTC